MPRSLMPLLLTGMLAIGLMAEPNTTLGCGYGPDPLREVAGLDNIIVGRIVAVEPQNRFAFAYPGAEGPTEFTVAILRVYDRLMGKETDRHIQIAFVQPRPVELGQVGCYLLRRQHDADFFMVHRTVERQEGTLEQEAFKQQVASFRNLGQLLDDPIAGLTSAHETQRLRTAALLMQRYRNPGPTTREMSPIPARESQLIMEALAGADWSNAEIGFRMSPQRLFNMIGATAATGWNPIGFNNPNDYENAAKRWLTANAKTHRIVGFVD